MKKLVFAAVAAVTMGVDAVEGLEARVAEEMTHVVRELGVAGTREFWKLERFRPGDYLAAKRSYAESAAKLYDYIFELPSMQKGERGMSPFS